MNEYIDGFVGFYEGLSIYIEKYMNWAAKSREHIAMMQLAGEYYEDYQKLLENKGENEFLTKASQLLLDIQTAVESQDKNRIKQLQLETEKIIQEEKDKLEYSKKFSEIFQADIQQMKLQEEKIKSCQALVDMDLKIHGEISEMTKEVLQVQHVELVEGRVREMQEKAAEIVQPEPEANKLYGGELDDLDSFLEKHKEKIKTQEKEAGKKTLVVNAFAGPGAGKTTACLETVAELKKKGYVAEYVSEYAKELVYDNLSLLDGSKEHQLHILEEQLKRLDRFIGKVDIIVTDAPILLNPVYLADTDPDYVQAISKLYGQYENFNFFVHRGESFVQEGRKENQEESRQKDQQIRDILDENDIFYGNFNHKTVDKLADKIEITYKRINAEQKQNEKNKDSLYENEKNEQREESHQASAYLKKTTKAKVIYGSSPEALLSKLQGWNQSRTEEMKFYSCYIQKLNPETNRYENPTRYEVESGKDITPIYLNLPHMGKDEFKKTIEKLKENGAKYNATKKAFYVTKGYHDLNLFADYLPITGTYAAEEHNRSKHELAFAVKVKENNTIEVNVEGKAPFIVNGDSYNMNFTAIQENSLKEFVGKFILPDKELKPAKEGQHEKGSKSPHREAETEKGKKLCPR